MSAAEPRASVSTCGPVLIVGTGLLGTSLALALRLGSQVSDAGPGAVEAVFISLIRLAGLRPSAEDPVWGRLAGTCELVCT